MSDHPAPPDVDKTAHHWWKIALSDSGPGKSARAKLRRATSPSEILSIAEVHELYAALGRNISPDRLALIAATLARVQESDAKPLARLFGLKSGETPALSEMRFQNLIRTTDPAALIAPLRRAMAVVGNRANVGHLARDLYYWGEKIRVQWCFDYYGAPSAAPETTEEDPRT